jgi:hypothetical protein
MMQGGQAQIHIRCTDWVMGWQALVAAHAWGCSNFLPIMPCKHSSTFTHGTLKATSAAYISLSSLQNPAPANQQ